jgi:hypothetical protein
VGREAARLFRIFGYIFAAMAATLVLLVWTSTWAPAQRFDMSGLLFLLQNVGFFFALGFAAIFASAAIGCWLMAIRCRWM